MTTARSIILGLLLLGAAGAAGAGEAAPLPAFPGAEGFGAHTVGGRGGRALFVTTLADRGPGSFRAAVEAEGPRIVVFRVSGTIELESALKIRNPRITIAGQTAPGGGICLKNYGVSIRAGEAIVRHLRFRPGPEAGSAQDALSVYKARNVIIDHCSTSWASDETLSVTGAGCSNVTVQWCLITESLDRSVHEKGAHGYGSLIRADGDITYHHNLYAHHRSRCPRPGTYGAERGVMLDFRNNAVYNWIGPCGYSRADRTTMNYVGNYLKPGPSTAAQHRNYAFQIGDDNRTLMYAADNFLEGVGAGRRDNWELVENAREKNKAPEELPAAPVRTESADSAFNRILAEAGATRPARDEADRRVVETVRQGTGRVINSPAEVGGWPELAAAPPPADGDDDGMPDDWERERGLDPADPADGAADRDGDGYTNIEEYLNSL